MNWDRYPYFEIAVYCLLIAHAVAFGQTEKPPAKVGSGLPWLDVIREDARLAVSIKLAFAKPASADEVLGLISKATGAKLTTQGELAQASQPFGAMTASNVPAWKIMEILATSQVVDGRWEKSGDGYVLHGKPKSFVLPPADAKSAKKETPPIKEDASLAKAMKARRDFFHAHPLAQDKRLQVRLTFVAKKPPLSDAMARLESATNLRFALADSLKHHDPDLGHIEFRETWAYLLMELIAQRDLDGGHWVKTEDGYRLEGVSRRLRPPPSDWRGAWIAGGLLAAGVVGFAIVGYRRKRRATPMQSG